MLTNTQLNEMSISELSQLNKRVVEIIRMKQTVAARLNSDNLKEGMTVRYKGTSGKIKDEKFLLKKINKKNGVCKSLTSGQLWNINLANIEEVNEVA